jgi:TPR repeat protein
MLGGIKARENPKQGLHILKSLVEEGYIGAMVPLALMYMSGRHVTKDHAKAESLLLRAANSDIALAQVLLATEFFNKRDSSSDAEGVAWLERATASGDPEAHKILAKLFKVGEHGVLKDEAKANSHDELAKEIEFNRLRTFKLV